MKYLKYTLYLVIVLVILFIGMGIMKPSVAYESEVSVNKSAEEAWAVMSDESKITEWIEGITKMEHVSGTPNTVGAVSKIYVVENGKEMVMEETITALKPNEHLAMTFTMGFMDMDYAVFLTEEAGKTNIRTESKSIGNGIVAKSILSFMPKSMKAQEETNLNNLKKLIEENTTNYFSEPNLNSSEESSL